MPVAIRCSSIESPEQHGTWNHAKSVPQPTGAQDTACAHVQLLLNIAVSGDGSTTYTAFQAQVQWVILGELRTFDHNRLHHPTTDARWLGNHNAQWAALSERLRLLPALPRSLGWVHSNPCPYRQPNFRATGSPYSRIPPTALSSPTTFALRTEMPICPSTRVCLQDGPNRSSGASHDEVMPIRPHKPLKAFVRYDFEIVSKRATLTQHSIPLPTPETSPHPPPPYGCPLALRPKAPRTDSPISTASAPCACATTSRQPVHRPKWSDE